MFSFLRRWRERRIAAQMYRDLSDEYFAAYLRWRDVALTCERALNAHPYAPDADALRDAAEQALRDARLHSAFGADDDMPA
jgi:hypothetical protein